MKQYPTRNDIDTSVEPTWRFIYEAVINKELSVKELEKCVVLGDIIRKAQREGKTLILYPSGEFKEV